MDNFCLPRDFVPLHYRIQLTDLDTVKNKFTGKVLIQFKCLKPSSVVHVNTRDLSIKSAVLQLGQQRWSPIGQSYEARTEALAFQFGKEIAQDFELQIEYIGVLQTNMSGFYRSDFVNPATNEKHFMLSTQFEATDARRAFPCVDEPDSKATFDISITADSKFTVLSNMPLAETIASDNSQSTHIFHTTPLMSTYLVAWAVGEFEFIESKTKQNIYPTLDGYSTQDGSSHTTSTLPIRIYTAKGKSHMGKFALSVVEKIIDYFSELFHIPYPLPKLDLLCVESYSHNAMENFSLITFRPTALLLDAANEDYASNPAAKKVAYVVCHEIAHQWFGNLVTMKWWDELWLNEGFATWVGYHAVSKIFPEWDVPSMVMLESHNEALSLDSLSESHPVKVSVHDPKDIDQVFDTISYLKGCSILEMISGFLGETPFLEGVSLYLQRNKFGNATMEDLFNCIGEVAKIDLLSRIKPWILEVGFPTLEVNLSNDGKKIVIQQEKFQDPDSKIKNSKEQHWWVPLMLTHGDQADFKMELTSRIMEIPAADDFNLLNTDGFGFYRVNYKSDKLFSSIMDNISSISSRSKMALISDVATLASVNKFLDLVSHISQVTDPRDIYVWKMICQNLIVMKTILYPGCDFQDLDRFDKYCLNIIEPLIKPALAYMSNASIAQDATQDKYHLLRAQCFETILSLAGQLSHPDVVEFSNNALQNNCLKPSNRSVIMTTVLSQPDTTLETFQHFVSMLDVAILDELETTLTCLAKVKNPALFQPCLSLLLKIDAMNIQFLASSWSTNPYIHDSLWNFVQEHQLPLFNKLKINPVIVGRFVGFSFQYFADPQMLTEMKQFFQGQDVSSYDKTLKQILEKVAKNSRYAQQHSKELAEYF